MVPDGVEEVELAKINLEQMDRKMKLLLDDIRCLTGYGDNVTDYCYALEKGDCSWMTSSTQTSLVKPCIKSMVSYFLQYSVNYFISGATRLNRFRIIQVYGLINIVL